MVLKHTTPTKKASHPIPQEAFDWYDEYAHGKISRREFLNRLGGLAVLGFSMTALVDALTPNYALAEQVSFNDPDIKATYETFPSPNGHGEGRGYLVMPQKKTLKSPTVLVIHENRGLNPYIKDVARRLAKDGFIAFAPDALYPLGGYPGNDDEGRAMQKEMDRAKIEQDFIAAANFLKQHEDGNGRLGGGRVLLRWIHRQYACSSNARRVGCRCAFLWHTRGARDPKASQRTVDDSLCRAR